MTGRKVPVEGHGWIRVEPGSVADLFVSDGEASLETLKEVLQRDSFPDEVFAHPLFDRLIALHTPLTLRQVEKLDLGERIKVIAAIGDELRAAHPNL